MTWLYVPAWHYRARAVVQRTWGWSPIEEMVLLTLDRTPGTISEIATSLKVPGQVVAESISRLMQFGIIEVRMSPKPVLATSQLGHEFVRSGKALPERTKDREIPISFLFELVGHSLLRNRNVKPVGLHTVPQGGLVVQFPTVGQPETEESMLYRVGNLMRGTLRSGEWLRGIKTVSSTLEKKMIAIDLDEVRAGMFPTGASVELVDALQRTARTGTMPRPKIVREPPSPSVYAEFESEQLIVGAEEHLRKFEEVAAKAKSDIFVLSTFVAVQDQGKGKEQRDRVFGSLAAAVSRGVRCHLFFGTSKERLAHAAAMDELGSRLGALRPTRGMVLVHRESVNSHAKILAADDGAGGAVAIVGSCNWLTSPFSAIEASAELRKGPGVALGLDLFRSIVSSLSSATRSSDALQFMASEQRRTARSPARDSRSDLAHIRVVFAHEHERLLRAAAHDAKSRFVCATNRVGSTMVPGVFNPAEVAGGRLRDVRVYYSRQSAPVKRSHVQAHRERLDGLVQVIGVKKPQVHAKFLLWDEDSAIITSMNWGSQTGSALSPLDEVGLFIERAGIATWLLNRLEQSIGRGSDESD